MPAAIAYLATAIGVAAGGSLAVAYIAYVGIYLGLTAGLSKIFAPKIPSVKDNLRAKSVMRRSAVENRKIVYGQAMTSGPIVYNNVSGDNNEYLWTAVVLSDGEIEDVVSVWLDSSEITKANISWTAGIDGAAGAGDGFVSDSDWVATDGTRAVQIYYSMGNAAQVAMSQLTTPFTEWTTNHRLRGIAYVVVKLL